MSSWKLSDEELESVEATPEQLLAEDYSLFKLVADAASKKLAEKILEAEHDYHSLGRTVFAAKYKVSDERFNLFASWLRAELKAEGILG